MWSPLALGATGSQRRVPVGAAGRCSSSQWARLWASRAQATSEGEVGAGEEPSGWPERGCPPAVGAGPGTSSGSSSSIPTGCCSSSTWSPAGGKPAPPAAAGSCSPPAGGRTPWAGSTTWPPLRVCRKVCLVALAVTTWQSRSSTHAISARAPSLASQAPPSPPSAFALRKPAELKTPAASTPDAKAMLKRRMSRQADAGHEAELLEAVGGRPAGPGEPEEGSRALDSRRQMGQRKASARRSFRKRRKHEKCIM
mmetsp:Transcript_17891/g.50098  ORF Transcript_17891/g.50098 Transcript_17891/m.50098 type:complete len:254 (-) Transcript_17891:508-1269(-)